jgi:hypothetical protein
MPVFTGEFCVNSAMNNSPRSNDHYTFTYRDNGGWTMEGIRDNINNNMNNSNNNTICPRCGYEWTPRVTNPKACPECTCRLHKARKPLPLKESQPAPAIAPAAIVPTPAQIPDAEPLDKWIGWSDERTTYDEQAGENITYREHIKTRKRTIIDRAPAY